MGCNQSTAAGDKSPVRSAPQSAQQSAVSMASSVYTDGGDAFNADAGGSGPAPPTLETRRESNSNLLTRQPTPHPSKLAGRFPIESDEEEENEGEK